MFRNSLCPRVGGTSRMRLLVLIQLPTLDVGVEASINYQAELRCITRFLNVQCDWIMFQDILKSELLSSGCEEALDPTHTTAISAVQASYAVRYKIPFLIIQDPILLKKFQCNQLYARFLTNQSGHVTFSSSSDWSKFPA